MLLIWKWLVLEHSRLPDYTPYLRTWTSRDLHSPGATFCIYLNHQGLASAEQPAGPEMGPKLPVRFLSFLQGSSAPPTTEVIPREQF